MATLNNPIECVDHENSLEFIIVNSAHVRDMGVKRFDFLSHFGKGNVGFITYFHGFLNENELGMETLFLMCFTKFFKNFM